jgi:transcriptional regulator with XRE-family HTH domain
MDEDELKLAKLLGANLKAQRQAKAWTQSALAERAEVSPHYVALLETARKLPTLKTLAILAHTLGIPTADLLKESDVQSNNAWLDELCQLAASIPEQHRRLIHELVRVTAQQLQSAIPRAKSSRRPAKKQTVVAKTKTSRR